MERYCIEQNSDVNKASDTKAKAKVKARRRKAKAKDSIFTMSVICMVRSLTTIFIKKLMYFMQISYPQPTFLPHLSC